MDKTIRELAAEAGQAIIALDKMKAILVAEEAVSGLAPADLLVLIEEGYRAGITVVGERFGRKEVFLPELVVAADILKSSFEIVEKVLRASNMAKKPLGRVVLATVKGDLHDIGKTMVSSLLTAKGFEVIDLGIDVAAEIIIGTALDARADIIALSALLTTTIGAQQEVVQNLEEAGFRNKFKVMIGGAASSKEWARTIGADAYGADAAEAVEIAVDLMRG